MTDEGQQRERGERARASSSSSSSLPPPLMALPIKHLAVILAVVFLMSQAVVYARAQATRASLIDAIVRDAAFRSLGKHPRTAIVYSVLLPQSLAGAEADASRYRTGSLGRYGAAIKEFRIPQGVVTRQHARRIVVVRENMGSDLSASIFRSYGNLSRLFRLVSPVVGLLVYNASRGTTGTAHLANSSRFVAPATELDLIATMDPITVDFSSESAGRDGMSVLCASFEPDGRVDLLDPVSPNICVARRQGHFGLIIRYSPLLPPPSGGDGGGGGDGGEVSTNKRAGKWKVAVTIATACVFAVVLLGMVGVAMVKTKKRRKEAEMERRAYEDEALQISMVGHVRAPSASSSRTAPVLEEEYSPSF